MLERKRAIASVSLPPGAHLLSGSPLALCFRSLLRCTLCLFRLYHVVSFISVAAANQSLLQNSNFRCTCSIAIAREGQIRFLGMRMRLRLESDAYDQTVGVVHCMRARTTINREFEHNRQIRLQRVLSVGVSRGQGRPVPFPSNCNSLRPCHRRLRPGLIIDSSSSLCISPSAV